jgi:hypothetical protein
MQSGGGPAEVQLLGHGDEVPQHTQIQRLGHPSNVSQATARTNRRCLSLGASQVLDRHVVHRL